jgi:hypothetical protein
MTDMGERPAAVRVAFVMWLVAVGAGVFETVLVVASGRAGDGAVAGVAVRGVVFALALVAALRMRDGRRWARVALVAGLGVFGLLSLVVAPVRWLLDGNSVGRLVAGSGTADLLFGGSRLLHVAAVVAGCALMFTRAANAWFRPAAPARASRARGSAGSPR